jgi:hypothetical protein
MLVCAKCLNTNGTSWPRWPLRPRQALAGITRKDAEVLTWLTIRGRSKDEALAEELWEHRKIAIELLEHEALMKGFKTKTVAPPARLAGTRRMVLTKVEIRRLEFTKWRLTNRLAV